MHMKHACLQRGTEGRHVLIVLSRSLMNVHKANTGNLLRNVSTPGEECTPAPVDRIDGVCQKANSFYRFLVSVIILC